MHAARWAIALALAVLASCCGGTLSPAAGQGAPRPHMVYILADDLGWKDVGFHGSDIQTPNLDKLAATGARLEQFYAQPMCTPAPGALLTGRYPHRYGLQTGVIPSAGTYGLATDEWLLSQTLKEAGYTPRPSWASGTSGMPNARTGRGSADSIPSTVPYWARSTTLPT